MREPNLSPSQRAYLFDRENFLARLKERASTLYESGYRVYVTAAPAVFAVVQEHSDGETAYFVNVVAHTCTCAFHRRQSEGELLTNDGTIVACKHLRGLPRLLRRMRVALKQQGDWGNYFRLRTHWVGALAARRRGAISEKFAASAHLRKETDHVSAYRAGTHCGG